MTTPAHHQDGDAFGPVFSVTDRGDDIVMETADPHDAGLPRYTLPKCLASSVAWAVLLFFAGPRVVGPRGELIWWVFVTAAVSLAVGVGLSFSIFEPMNRRYGRRSTATATTTAPALLGAGIGAIAGAAGMTRATVPELPDEIPALILAVAGAGAVLMAPVMAVRAWRGVRYAVRQQQIIRRLRDLDRRVPGVLVSVEFQKSWSNGYPMFTAVVSVGEGATATAFTSHFVTRQTRVPLPGNRVVVRYDPQVPLDRAALVELDPAVTPRFDPDSGRYGQPSNN